MVGGSQQTHLVTAPRASQLPMLSKLEIFCNHFHNPFFFFFPSNFILHQLLQWKGLFRCHFSHLSAALYSTDQHRSLCLQMRPNRAASDADPVHREIGQLPWVFSALEATAVHLQPRNAIKKESGQ